MEKGEGGKTPQILCIKKRNIKFNSKLADSKAFERAFSKGVPHLVNVL